MTYCEQPPEPTMPPVTCPRCGKADGCVTPSGKKTDQHRSRWRAWALARDAHEAALKEFRARTHHRGPFELRDGRLYCACGDEFVSKDDAEFLASEAFEAGVERQAFAQLTGPGFAFYRWLRARDE